MKNINLLQKRAIKVIKNLQKAYPEARIPKRHEDPYKVLISTILSAQSTDKIAKKVANKIYRKYKTIRGLARAKRAALERDIHETGFYKNKAGYIIDSSKKILSDFYGNVPDTMEGLTGLNGVGRKTANIVLAWAFKKASGIAVDTHVKRIARRLGFTTQHTPGKIEMDLLKVIPKTYWLDFNYVLVTHGRKTCRSQRPLCCDCSVSRLCPSNAYKRKEE